MGSVRSFVDDADGSPRSQEFVDIDNNSVDIDSQPLTCDSVPGDGGSG
jgi:hypothetical protein